MLAPPRAAAALVLTLVTACDADDAAVDPVPELGAGDHGKLYLVDLVGDQVLRIDP